MWYYSCDLLCEFKHHTDVTCRDICPFFNQQCHQWQPWQGPHTKDELQRNQLPTNANSHPLIETIAHESKQLLMNTNGHPWTKMATPVWKQLPMTKNNCPQMQTTVYDKLRPLMDRDDQHCRQPNQMTNDNNGCHASFGLVSPSYIHPNVPH